VADGAACICTFSPAWIAAFHLSEDGAEGLNQEIHPKHLGNREKPHLVRHLLEKIIHQKGCIRLRQDFGGTSPKPHLSFRRRVEVPPLGKTEGDRAIGTYGDTANLTGIAMDSRRNINTENRFTL
jgi:hypothetical protein